MHRCSFTAIRSNCTHNIGGDRITSSVLNYLAAPHLRDDILTDDSRRAGRVTAIDQSCVALLAIKSSLLLLCSRVDSCLLVVVVVVSRGQLSISGLSTCIISFRRCVTFGSIAFYRLLICLEQFGTLELLASFFTDILLVQHQVLIFNIARIVLYRTLIFFLPAHTTSWVQQWNLSLVVLLLAHRGCIGIFSHFFMIFIYKT